MSRRATDGSIAKIADALHATAIRLLRTVRKEDEETGISLGRLSALSVLVFAGPQWLTDLARIEQVKPPTMTKIVAGLEGEGLARRRVDPVDARVVVVEATAVGRRILHQGRKRRVLKIATGLKSLAREELEAVERATVIVQRVISRL